MASTTHLVNSIIASEEAGQSIDGKIVPIYQEQYLRDPLYSYVGNSA